MTKHSPHKFLLLSLLGALLLFAALPSLAQSERVEEVVVDSTVFRFDEQPGENTGVTDTVEDSFSEDEYHRPQKISDTPVLRPVPERITDSLKAAREFEYANDPAYWIKKPKEQKKPKRDFFEWLFQSNTAKAIGYIIIGLVIIFVIYRIIVNNNLFYRASRKNKNQVEEEITEEEYDNIDQKVSEAINRQDFRLAVRYLYVKTLHQMGNKGWIRFHQQGTNNEYVSQMTNHPLASEFSFITRVYEYVWYGEFALSETQFQAVHQNFKKIIKASA